ncbi:MAG: maleylpyruvate isomerase N-terminal domain-containing protein [Actinomycetota bacterium]
MTNLLPDAEVSAAYIELRARVVALLRSLPESAGDRVVPHCPAWTVRELAAHLLGVPDDIINGRMEGVATDAWTQAQVERHRGKTLKHIADAFDGLSTQFDAMLPHFPAMARSQMTMDAVTHEHDLRHAVGQPGARDSAAVSVAVAWLRQWVSGRNVPQSDSLYTAGLTEFDLLRCLTGRRSLSQAEGLGLPSDVLAVVQAGSPFRPPAQPVVE